MDKIDILLGFDDLIREAYRAEGLVSLADVTHENERNNLSVFYEATEANMRKRGLHSEYFMLHNDLFMCSDQMVYFTAQLFLYRGFLNNPLDDQFSFGGREVFPNYQNIPSKRYNMIADVASEKTYNFWDRIGDLIATYFPTEFPRGKPIYFGKAIDVATKHYPQSPNLLWLADFKKNTYTTLNQKRKTIVHHTSSQTAYHNRHINVNSRQEMEELWHERLSLPDYYKEQIEYSHHGFAYTMEFLREISV